MLGALSLGDIGLHFPPDDMRFKDISSIKLLNHVDKLIKQQGYKIVNTDSTILAQKPKLLPYINEIKTSVANALGIDIQNVSVKATTTEKLGDIGKGLAIAAEAVVLLEKI